MKTKIQDLREKRNLISVDEAKDLLRDVADKLFSAYDQGIAKFNDMVGQIRIEARHFVEPTLLNALIAEALMDVFPESWRRGRYGRIFYMHNGLQILVKKLNASDKPSYVPTFLARSIFEQLQEQLFSPEEAGSHIEPILIFGYTKSADGSYTRPRIATAFIFKGYELPSTHICSRTARIYADRAGEKDSRTLSVKSF